MACDGASCAQKDLYPDARTSVNKYKKGSAVRATRTLLKLTKPLRGREDVENLRLGQKTTEKARTAASCDAFVRLRGVVRSYSTAWCTGSCQARLNCS